MPESPAEVYWSGRQGRILAFLHQYVTDHGYPPSLREVGAAVGLNSTSSVAHQLTVLEARGHIERDPRKPRALRIITHPPDA